MDPKRIAIVAVHGVADQQPGDTARAIVDLLVASRPNDAAYTALATETFTLGVDPLEPLAGRPAVRADATPSGEDRPLMKSLKQSYRSDLQTGGSPLSGAPDRGIAVTDYLLTKHAENGAAPEAYESRRIGLERRHGGSTDQVDVYEMYWADLSRLSGLLPRIVTELFTMIFRLSKLGRSTVAEARRALAVAGAKPRSLRYRLAWGCAGELQNALDWLFVNGLAMLFLQLSLLGAVLIALGLAAAIDPTTLHRTAAGGLAIVGLLWLAYRHRDTRRSSLAWPIALVAIGIVPLLFALALRPAVTVLLVLALVTFLSEAGLRVADDRFPLVRFVGRCLWIGTLIVICLGAWLELGAAPPWDTATQGSDPKALQAWLHATLYASEVVLLVVKWAWVAAGCLLFAWLVAGGFAAGERGYESRAGIATGRLGITVSIGAFLTTAMAIWALLSTALDASVKEVAYAPCIFAVEAPASAASAPTGPAATNRCLLGTQAAAQARAAAGTGPAPAAAYLADRYRASTAAFSLVVALLLVLLLYLASMFGPSVLAEMQLLVQRTREANRRNIAQARSSARPEEAEAEAAARADRSARTRRLGRWLSSGYRGLDAVVLFVSVLAVLVGLFVACLFAASLFSFDIRLPAFLTDAAHPTLLAWFRDAEPAIAAGSRNLLQPFVLGAAGVVAALTLLGGVLSKYLPALRAPLDIALDVDNHFREFPRTSIPRARIFSRYAALLAHIDRQQYERVVIVAHSQGTVISAELLRFLASPDGSAPLESQRPRLLANTPQIHLLTLGCPLRQLYAARFPTLYRWVIARSGRMTGPHASDVGVDRWANAFTSGDYVGRWLWSDSPDDGDALGHPMHDGVDEAGFGRMLAYDGWRPDPPEAALLATAHRLEVCLGLGAHTHYFEPGQTTVAWLVDHLVSVAAPAP